MTKAHWEEPASNKGKSATKEQDLKPGKSDLVAPKDMDWHKAGKEQGRGFSGNAASVLVRGNNPAAGSYRNPPEHKYNLTDFGAGSAANRIEIQNNLAAKKK